MSTLAANVPVVPCKWETIFNAWLHSLLTTELRGHSVEPLVDESQVSLPAATAAGSVIQVHLLRGWMRKGLLQKSIVLSEQYFGAELHQSIAVSESDSEEKPLRYGLREVYNMWSPCQTELLGLDFWSYPGSV